MSVALSLDGAGACELGEVPGGIGLRGSERAHDFGDVQGLDAEELKDLESDRFAEGLEEGGRGAELGLREHVEKRCVCREI